MCEVNPPNISSINCRLHSRGEILFPKKNGLANSTTRKAQQRRGSIVLVPEGKDFVLWGGVLFLPMRCFLLAPRTSSLKTLSAKVKRSCSSCSYLRACLTVPSTVGTERLSRHPGIHQAATAHRKSLM